MFSKMAEIQLNRKLIPINVWLATSHIYLEGEVLYSNGKIEGQTKNFRVISKMFSME